MISIRFKFSFLVLISLFSANSHASTMTLNSTQEYFFLQSDHSQLKVDWLGQEKNSLPQAIKSLGLYFKKAAENKESVSDQLVLASGALQGWLTNLVKTVHPDLHLNTEISFLQKSDAKHVRTYAETELKKSKAALLKNAKYKNLSDEELTNLAIEKMPIGFDSQLKTVEEFKLTKNLAGPQIEILAGDTVITSVKGQVRLLTSIVVSLPKRTENFNFDIAGYALLDRFSIPSSKNGLGSVYAIINIDLLTSLQKIKLSDNGDMELPLASAKLKVEFANQVIVNSGKVKNPNDHRVITFTPVRFEHDPNMNNLADTFEPTARLPNMRALNILPKAKIWNPLARVLGPQGFFDLGFFNFYGFELDLLKLDLLSLSGRLEFYNRNTAFDSSIKQGQQSRGSCLTIQDQDHCLNWQIRPGDFLDRYIVGLINKSFEPEKQALKIKFKEKTNELSAILNGSYQAYQTRVESQGDYSEFSKKMISDLCRDEILQAHDEQCQNTNVGK